MKFSSTQKTVLTLIFLALMVTIGCSKTSESVNIKISNANTAVVTANTAEPVMSPMPPSPPPANAQLITANQNRRPPVPEPTPSIGSGGNDFALFSQIRSQITSDPELIDTVIVEVKDGNVTLSGTVPNDALKAKAEHIASGVKGIKSLKNNVRVSP